MKLHKFHTALYCSLFLLAFSSCRDETVVTTLHGTVIDKTTGAPIEGASIEISRIMAPYVFLTSDQNGKFSHSDTDNFGIFKISKDGYVLKGSGKNTPNHISGEINELVYPLVPKDGALYLNIEKQPGSPDTVRVVFFSQIQRDEADLSSGKSWDQVVDMTGKDYESIFFDLASGEFLKIYWKPSPIINGSFNSYPFADSLYISKNDTATFTLKY